MLFRDESRAANFLKSLITEIKKAYLSFTDEEGLPSVGEFPKILSSLEYPTSLRKTVSKYIGKKKVFFEIVAMEILIDYFITSLIRIWRFS